jgi:monoamine oxidase
MRVGLVAGFVVVAFALGCTQEEAATPQRTEVQEAEVVVVGAGMSGLVSALSLARQGVDVILLEKEQQVGGRMYSVSLGGVACNLGAQYLYSGGHPLIDSYMEELPLQPVLEGTMLWDGQYVGTGTEVELLAELPISQEATGDLIAAFIQMSLDYTEISEDREFFMDIEPESSSWTTLDGQSCQDYLSGYSPDVYKIINSQLGSEAGGEIAELSALAMVGSYGGPDLEIGRALTQGGNPAIIERMTEDFLEAGGRLELDSEVTAVVQNGDAVNVTCRDGREFTSAHAIVATQVDVVIDIVKDLPASKREALEAVEYGAMAVVGMHLTGLPNGDELAGAMYIGESDIGGYINQTGEVLGNPDTGTVISVIVIDEAMLQLDDQAMLEPIVEALHVVNPDLDAETDILDYEVQRWPRGLIKNYSGFLTQYQSALREPVGRVYFAGDYSYDGAIGGAAWSGERAASAVLSAMGN